MSETDDFSIFDVFDSGATPVEQTDCATLKDNMLGCIVGSLFDTDAAEDLDMKKLPEDADNALIAYLLNNNRLFSASVVSIILLFIVTIVLILFFMK